MKTKINRVSLDGFKKLTGAAALFLLTALAPSAQAQTTGFNGTGAGPFDYNTTANWVGGTINGIWDPTLTLTATQTTTFAANTTASNGLAFRYAGAFNETLQGTGGNRILTLGGDIIVNPSSSRTITIGSTGSNQNLAVDLGGAVRTFSVVGGGNGGNFGNTLAFVNAVSNGGVLVTGGASGGGQVRFDNLANTLASVTVKGADANFNGSANTGANTVDTISGTLTAASGADIVSITAAGSRNTLLQANAFVRDAGATILFRGANLGVNSIASATAGSANVKFTTGPALIGSGSAGTSTVGILAGAFGSTSSSGSGFGATGGLVTYDATNGVRLLGASEYNNTLVDGSVVADNVKLSNSSNSLSINTLTQTTTINSLSFVVSGTPGNNGITVNGTATLKINSGVIFADQGLTGPVATDGMTLGSNITLDMNGQEAIVLANTTLNGGGTQSSSAGLFINSTITNATGLTIGDGVNNGVSGYIVLGGATANTYTGNTTINGAIVQLNKSVANSFGNIIINHGSLYDTGDQIANTANVTINGGGVLFLNGSNNSGSATNETINDLTMTGGLVSPGSGSGNTFNVNGNAALSGGTIGGASQGKLNVTGTTSLSGGVISVGSNNSASLYNSKATLTGAVTITNTAEGTAAYTPITISAGAASGNLGGQVELSSDLTFVGNTNTNTVTIAGLTGTGQQGVVALNGARTFNVGNGAALVDLTVTAPLINGTATGGLSKTGAGTLALNGANTYTGATSVSAGTLLINGSLNAGSAVTVSGSGTLGGTAGTVGAVTVATGGSLSPGSSIGTFNTSSVDMQSGSILKLEINTGSLTADLLNVSGAFNITTGATLQLSLLGTDTLLSLGQVFTIVDYGTWNSGLFNGYADDSVFALGLNSFQIDYNNVGGVLTLTTVAAVPEPSTYALFGMGLAALWVLRRQRSRTV